MMSDEHGKKKIYELRLYVAGETPKSMAAIRNIKRVCEEKLECEHHIEIIDLQKHPELAKDDQIIAVPPLIKRLPLPVRKIMGDLSNEEKVLVGLDIKDQQEE